MFRRNWISNNARKGPGSAKAARAFLCGGAHFGAGCTRAANGCSMDSRKKRYFYRKKGGFVAFYAKKLAK